MPSFYFFVKTFSVAVDNHQYLTSVRNEHLLSFAIQNIDNFYEKYCSVAHKISKSKVVWFGCDRKNVGKQVFLHFKKYKICKCANNFEMRVLVRNKDFFLFGLITHYCEKLLIKLIFVH